MSARRRKVFLAGLVVVGAVMVLLVVTAWAQPTVHPWPMSRHDARGTAKSPDSGPGEPTIRWTFPTNYFINTSPAIDKDGTIYTVSTDDHLYAINPDGTQKWAVEIDAKVSGWGVSAPALSHEGTVYIYDYDGNRLRALAPADGHQMWDTDDLGAYGRGVPVVGDSGLVYIFADSILYATGGDAIQWQTDKVTGLEDYGFDRGHMALSPNGERIYAYGTGMYQWVTSYFYILNANTGAIIWQTEKDIEELAVAPDGTVFASQRGTNWSLTAMEPISLTTQWTEDLEAEPGPLALDAIRASIYTVTFDGKLHAFSFSGTHKWDLDLQNGPFFQSAPIIGDDGTIYVNEGSGRIYAVSPGGDLLWNISLGTYAGPPAMGANGTIYAGTARDLVAVNEATKTNYNGHSYLYVHKYMTWPGAKAYAQALGGHLVTIGDYDENQFVIDLATSSGRVGDFWIGLSDEGQEGTFSWVTGEPLEYVSWAPGQPEYDFDKDYVAYLTTCCRIWGVLDNNATRQFVVEWEGGGPIYEIDEDFDDGQADNWVDDGSGVWSVQSVTIVQDHETVVDLTAEPEANSVYQMTGTQGDARRHAYYDQDFTNFVFEADVRKVAGDSTEYVNSYGLRMRADETGNNYYTIVLVANGQYLLGKQVEGKWTAFQGWTESLALNVGQGQWNRLKVVASGATLSFYANDTLLKTVQDTSLSSGKASLVARDSADADEPDTVQFDNVSLQVTPKSDYMFFLPVVIK